VDGECEKLVWLPAYARMSGIIGGTRDEAGSKHAE
jgi:hypothetical protein